MIFEQFDTECCIILILKAKLSPGMRFAILVSSSEPAVTHDSHDTGRRSHAYLSLASYDVIVAVCNDLANVNPMSNVSNS